MDPNSFQNPTSIVQQGQTAVESYTSGVGTAFNSVVNGAQNALNGIAKGLTTAGQNAADAVKNTLNQFGAFSSISKFTDNLTAPKQIPSVRPENTRSAAQALNAGGAPILAYPLDLGRYYISFTFMESYRSTSLVPRTHVPHVAIFLPMPSDLVDRFGVQYADKQLGALGVLQESGALNTLSQGDFSKESLNQAFYNAGYTVTQAGNATAILVAGSGLADTSLGTAAIRAAGAIPNPYQALAFQGVDLRSHTFRFKCSPNSEGEAEELRKIILEFKKHMLPEKSGLLYNYPDVCTISFSSKNEPYSFKNCFLKNMSVNYAPSGTPAFFKGGKYAAEVEISLEFGEIEPVTRDDLGGTKGTGDISGTYGETYGKPSGMALQSATKEYTDKANPSKSNPTN